MNNGNLEPFNYEWQRRYLGLDDEPTDILVRTMVIPDAYILSVVLLYLNEDAAHAKKSPIGSGFIISVPSKVSSHEFRYVVTNRHIAAYKKVTENPPHAPAIRLNLFTGTPIIIQTEPNDWDYHDEHDDVAVYFLEHASQHWPAYVPVSSLSFISDGAISHHNFGVGDQAFMLGRWINKHILTPSARFGNVSMMPAQKLPRKVVIDGKEVKKEQELFLVEMYSTGGFSGSPVFVRKLPWSPGRHVWPRRDRTGLRDYENEIREYARDEIFLLGINCGHAEERLPLWHYQKNTVDQEKKTLYVKGNQNVALVVPAWKIIEVLSGEEMMSERRQIENDFGDEEVHAFGTEDAAGDMPAALLRTIKHKIESGEDESVDEDVFRRAMDQTIFPDKNGPEQ